jgi:hypothetical protein
VKLNKSGFRVQMTEEHAGEVCKHCSRRSGTKCWKTYEKLVSITICHINVVSTNNESYNLGIHVLLILKILKVQNSAQLNTRNFLFGLSVTSSLYSIQAVSSWKHFDFGTMSPVTDKNWDLRWVVMEGGWCVVCI